MGRAVNTRMAQAGGALDGSMPHHWFAPTPMAAYDRNAASDGKYRFVIDMATPG